MRTRGILLATALVLALSAWFPPDVYPSAALLCSGLVLASAIWVTRDSAPPRWIYLFTAFFF